jgi:hypothetical protein
LTDPAKPWAWRVIIDRWYFGGVLPISGAEVAQRKKFALDLADNRNI